MLMIDLASHHPLVGTSRLTIHESYSNSSSSCSSNNNSSSSSSSSNSSSRNVRNKCRRKLQAGFCIERERERASEREPARARARERDRDRDRDRDSASERESVKRASTVRARVSNKSFKRQERSSREKFKRASRRELQEESFKKTQEGERSASDSFRSESERARERDRQRERERERVVCVCVCVCVRVCVCVWTRGLLWLLLCFSVETTVFCRATEPVQTQPGLSASTVRIRFNTPLCGGCHDKTPKFNVFPVRCSEMSL